MRLPPLSVLLTRFALAFCFLGFGVWELIQPRMWITYVPTSLASVMNPSTLVLTHGIALTVTGLGILSGWMPKLFTGLATLIMLEICVEIFLQEGFTDIFIRDVSILLFTSAMFAKAWSSSKSAAA